MKNTMCRSVIPPVALMVVSLCAVSCSGAGGKTYIWDVKWYKVDEMNLDFTTYLGSEKWNSVSFYKNWEGDKVYHNLHDFVGFVASATIYSIGKNYSFTLYNVNNEASLYIDGEKVLNVSSGNSGTANIYIPEGEHEIRIEYKELCCDASIGFTAFDVTAFEVKKLDEGGLAYEQILPVIAVIIPIALLVSVYVMIKGRKKR